MCSIPFCEYHQGGKRPCSRLAKIQEILDGAVQRPDNPVLEMRKPPQPGSQKRLNKKETD